jgi:hypothetical protein
VTLVSNHAKKASLAKQAAPAESSEALQQRSIDAELLNEYRVSVEWRIRRR